MPARTASADAGCSSPGRRLTSLEVGNRGLVSVNCSGDSCCLSVRMEWAVRAMRSDEALVSRYTLVFLQSCVRESVENRCVSTRKQ